MKPVFLSVLEIAAALGVRSDSPAPSSAWQPNDVENGDFAEFAAGASARPYVPPAMAMPTGGTE